MGTARTSSGCPRVVTSNRLQENVSHEPLLVGVCTMQDTHFMIAVWFFAKSGGVSGVAVEGRIIESRVQSATSEISMLYP